MRNTNVIRILSATALLSLAACNQEPSGPAPASASSQALQSAHGDTTGTGAASVPPLVGLDSAHTDSVPHPTVAVDQAPSLILLSPQWGDYATGSLQFTCTSTDKEDGRLDSVVWNSSLAGDFGVGTDFRADLPDGAQLITISVVDSKGHRSMDSARVKIEGPTALHTTGNLDRANYQYGDRAKLTVMVLNQGAPRAGVNILADVVRLQTGYSVGHYTAVTDGEGGAILEFDVEASRFPAGMYRVDAQSQEEGFSGQTIRFPISIAAIDTTRN